MPKPSAYTDFVTDPDQEARRAELRAFIGLNADAFMAQYEVIRARAGAAPKAAGRFKVSFLPMAFFLGPCWFFYRRMWTWAWGFVALYVLLAFLPATSRIGLPLAIATAMFGRQAYVTWAVYRIAKLRSASGGMIGPDALAAAGGVSKRAGWISSVILGVLAALGLAAILLAASLHLPPPQ